MCGAAAVELTRLCIDKHYRKRPPEIRHDGLERDLAMHLIRNHDQVFTGRSPHLYQGKSESLILTHLADSLARLASSPGGEVSVSEKKSKVLCSPNISWNPTLHNSQSASSESAMRESK
jgi:hypothetical protein